jgi:hypothetical protein
MEEAGTTIGTMIPAMEFSGMIDPMSSLQGIGAAIGQAYPMTHLLTIARDLLQEFRRAAHVRPDASLPCTARSSGAHLAEARGDKRAAPRPASPLIPPRQALEWRRA